MAAVELRLDLSALINALVANDKATYSLYRTLLIYNMVTTPRSF